MIRTSSSHTIEFVASLEIAGKEAVNTGFDYWRRTQQSL